MITELRPDSMLCLEFEHKGFCRFLLDAYRAICRKEELKQHRFNELKQIVYVILEFVEFALNLLSCAS